MMSKVRNKINNMFSEDGGRIGYYFAYTILFSVAAFFCFSWFIFPGRSLIWKGDGWNEQFNATLYYARYLRGIVRTFIDEHKLIIPDWDFYICEGSGILDALHLYVVGDPITLLSVFVPTSYMHYFFSASQILRLYLSGIAFSMLCFETGIKNRFGIIAGALAYSFCSWNLACAPDHPSFLNPLIYFPLMLFCVERVLRRKKNTALIIVTAITAVCNFYFFYMIVLLTVIYTLIRLIIIYKTDFISIGKNLFSIGIPATVGVCISGAVFVPVLMQFAGDSRVAISQHFYLFYPLYYYLEIPTFMICGLSDYWLYLGVGILPVLATVLMFIQKKENTTLKVFFISCILLVVFPLGGRLFNGMGYATNRWIWAFVLLFCYIMAKMWDLLLSMTLPQFRILTVFCIIYYFLIILFDHSRKMPAITIIPIMFIALYILNSEFMKLENKKHKSLLLIGICFICQFNTAFWMYSSYGGNYAAQCVENTAVAEKLINNETGIIKALAGGEYKRYSGRYITENANMVNRISNTQYYWSMSNSYTNRFRDDLAMREQKFYSYMGYDDRTTPIGLSAVTYYTIDNNGEAGMPYGYSLVCEEDDFSVYKNDNELPLGYCYDSYISNDTWQSMNPVQRQEIELEAAWLDNEDISEIREYKSKIDDYRVPFEIDYSSDGLIVTDTGFITTEENTVLVLKISETIPNAETYVGFDGIEFIPTSEYDLYFGKTSVDPLDAYGRNEWRTLSYEDKRSIIKEKLFWNPILDPDFVIDSPAGVRKIIHYQQPESAYSSGRHDYIANMGYSMENVDTITITLPLRGVYSFGDFRIYKIPMDNYSDKVETLKSSALENVVIGTDEVMGDISVEKEKLLCVAIPFSKGWRAYIDDNPAKVLCLNGRYLGVFVDKGKHTVRFHYDPLYKMIGCYISIAGLIVYIVSMIVNISLKKRKTNKQENDQKTKITQ